MNSLVVFDRLKEGILQRLANKFVWGPEEVPIFGADFRNINFDGSREPKTLMLTCGSLYVFTFKQNGHVVHEGKFSLLDLSIISYDMAGSLALAFGNTNISISGDEAAMELLVRILFLCESFFFGLPEEKQKIKTNYEDGVVVPKLEITTRPKNLMQLRMIAYAHRDNTKFSLQCLAFIREWDEKPTQNLILTQNFITGYAAAAISEAVAVDNCIKNLTLDNFSSMQLDVVLKTIFEFSQTIIKINLENYVEPPSQQYTLGATAKCKINDIRFHNCNPLVIIGVLEGLYSYEGEIRNLSISRCKLTASHFTKIYECINKLPCMTGLCNFKFEEGTADAIDIKEFADFMSTIFIKALTISRTSVDISSICSSIFPRTDGLKQLTLTTGKMVESIKGDIELPQSLNYIDISKSQINHDTLRSFLKVIFSKPRKHLLALNLSDLATSSSMNDIVKCFNIQNPAPILSELNFSGNNLSSDNILSLIKFLKTQKYLQYLNVSRCLNDNIPESLSHLSTFINEFKLKCFELSCSSSSPLKMHAIKFFNDLKGKCQLTTITMERTQMGDQGLMALYELTKGNKYISSISVDGAIPTNPQVFEGVYNSFLHLERLGSPKFDFARHKGTVNIKKELGKKPGPKPLAARLNEYDLIELTSDPSIMDEFIEFTRSISDPGKHNINMKDVTDALNESIQSTTFPFQQNENADIFINTYLLKTNASTSK